MGAREGKGGNYHRVGNKWNSGVAAPTQNVADDTFAKYRDLMTAVIAKAKEGTGIA